MSNIHGFCLETFLYGILEQVKNRLRRIGSFVERVHKMALEVAVRLNREKLSGSGENRVNRAYRVINILQRWIS